MKIQLYKDRLYRIQAGKDEGHAKLEGSLVALVKQSYFCGTPFILEEEAQPENIVEATVSAKGRFLTDPVLLYFIEGPETLKGRWYPVTGVRLRAAGRLPDHIQVPEVVI